MVVILKAMGSLLPNPFAGVGVVLPIGLSTLVLEASGFYVLPCTLVDHRSKRIPSTDTPPLVQTIAGGLMTTCMSLSTMGTL